MKLSSSRHLERRELEGEELTKLLVTDLQLKKNLNINLYTKNHKQARPQTSVLNE